MNRLATFIANVYYAAIQVENASVEELLETTTKILEVSKT